MSDEEKQPLILNGSTTFLAEGKFTFFLGFVCFAAVLSSFNYGYHIGVLNNPKQVMTNCTELGDPSIFLDLPPCFKIDDVLWGTIVGMFAIGGLVGGLVAGFLADLLGRKTLILLNNLFFMLGSLLLGYAVSDGMLVAGRIIVGIASGISTVAVPMYLGEIAPANYRGAIGVLTQLSVTVGISASQLLGLELSYVPGWRWLVGLTFFFAIFQLIIMPCAPQTPRWLIMKNRNEEAKVALGKLRGSNNQANVDAEFDYIFEGQINAGGSSLSIKELLLDSSLRKPLVIALVLQLVQQLSGINAVFYYSTSIFERSNPDNAQILTVSVGILNVLLTVVSVFLMDKAGRRALLMIGQIGMMVTSGLYTIGFVYEVSWLTILCTYTFVSSFAVGLGPIPFLILAEIFPTKAVGTAASLALPLNWGCNYLVGQFFPLMSDNLGDYVFLPFAGILFLAFLFTLKFVPETKGKTLEEITDELRS